MLAEAIAWLRIGCSPGARKLGYRHEAAALRVKFRRCQAAWQPHLDATRRVLARSAALATSGRPGGTGLILGAGLLADVPLADLLERFDRVTLVDVARHPEARAAMRAFGPRVRYIDHDVTGSIAGIAHNPRVAPSPDDSLAGVFSPEVRWIASVNILTQLPLLPCARLLDRGMSTNDVHAIAEAISSAHLRALVGCGVPVALVTEVRDITTDRAGARIEDDDHWPTLSAALAGCRLEELARWTWLLHPPGELPHGRTGSREVAGLHLHASA